MLLPSVLAVICGAEGWTDVACFGKAKIKFLKSFLALSNRILSHDILGVLFLRLFPETTTVVFSQLGSVNGFIERRRNCRD